MQVLQQSLFDGEEMPEEVPAVLPRVQYGDLWQLGQHRLLCTDCRNGDVVQQLMQGKTAQLAIHDPPYGLTARMVSHFGNGQVVGKAHPVKRNTFAPVYGDNEPFDPQHLITSGQTVVIFGANHFADKLPASPAWIVWDKREELPSNHMSDCEMAWVSCGNRARIIRHKWNGFDRASERGEPRVHPTQKPLKVWQQIIRWYSQEDDLVTDWYAGSGTTLLAAEMTKRRACVCEISVDYCNIILARYEMMTGKQVVLLYRIENERA
jgi:site-specific DNA-methyltransferase (adenine-specific)/modification methylase